MNSKTQNTYVTYVCQKINDGCVQGPKHVCVVVCTYTKMDGDSEQRKKQTLMWMNNYPRNKLNMKNMVMVISENGIPTFVPKHLV